MEQLHVVLSFIAVCSVCGRRTERTVKDYGKLSLLELEQRMAAQDVTVSPISCGNCSRLTLPNKMRMVDQLKGKVISEAKIGQDVPVIDGAAGGYVYSRTEEEQSEIDRGFAKWDKHVESYKEPFFIDYENHAINNWNSIFVEITKHEFEAAYITLGWQTLNKQSTVLMYRKDVMQKLRDELIKRMFWRAANEEMYNHFSRLGIEAWDFKKDLKLFGRERVRYLVLHFPIPDELEGLRSRHIGELVKRENTEQGFLYRRIEQLSERLEKTNIKANRYKLEVEDLLQKLSGAYKEIERLRQTRVEIRQETGQTDKIERLKGLISELKQENRNLLRQVPIEADEQVADQGASDIYEDEAGGGEISASFQERLRGKTIAFFGGWPRQVEKDFSCSVLLHDTRKQDPDFFNALRIADAYIVWTEHISHDAMWEIKEWAIDRDVPIHYLRGMNIEKALREVEID